MKHRPARYNARYFRNLLLFAAVLLTCAVTGTLLSLCYQQADQFVNPISLPAAGSPADWGAALWHDAAFTSADGVTLRGWYIPPTRGDAALLFVHGHGGNRGQFSDVIPLYLRQGYGALVFDLRNNGTSGGHVTTMGLLESEDVLAAYAYLAAQPEVRRIALYGASMGGATALRAMARLPDARALFVDTAYTSLLDVTADGVRTRTGLPSFPFAEIIVAMSSAMSGANLFDLRPLDDAARIAPRPLMIMHGTADATIPAAHAQALYDAAGEPRYLYLVPGGGHGGQYWRDPAEYERRVLGFFARYLPVESPQ